MAAMAAEGAEILSSTGSEDIQSTAVSKRGAADHPDDVSHNTEHERLKLQLRQASMQSAHEDFGGGTMGMLRHKVDTIVHNPHMETLIIFLILTEVVCVSIELVLTEAFPGLKKFPSNYKKLHLSWSELHPTDCVVVADYARRLLLMAGYPLLYGGSMDMEMTDAARRMLSGGASSGPLSAGCFPMTGYSWHHTAAITSKICLSVMLIEIFMEIFVDGLSEFFIASHGCDWKHFLHIFDFFVVGVSWIADVLLADHLSGEASLLVILRLWRVIRVVVGFASFVKRDQEKEQEKQALLQKLRHATKYLKACGELAEFKQADKDMDDQEMVKLAEEADRLRDTDPLAAAEIDARILEWKENQGDFIRNLEENNFEEPAEETSSKGMGAAEEEEEEKG